MLQSPKLPSLPLLVGTPPPALTLTRLTSVTFFLIFLPFAADLREGPV